MSVSDLCNNFVTSAKLKDESERSVIDFCEAPWGLGFGSVKGVPPLLPVQRFILKCYYNIPLDDQDHRIIINDKFNEKERFRFTEMEYIKFLYEDGRINIKEITGNPDDYRPNINLVIGRRGTKTSTIAILISFETYKLLRKFSPQEYYGIIPDDEIRITCLATAQEQSAELFRRVTGHLERSDYFNKYANKPTLGYMQLNTQRDLELYGGARPSIRIVSSPCSGRGARSHNNIIAILDEMAYFFESETSADKSDSVVYDAVTPSVAKFNSPEGEPHGKVICISSPATRKGKFYELYERSFDKDCNDLLMIKAPTWEVDFTLSPKFLRAKYAENPTSYMCEYGADFSDRVTAWIENEQVLRMNVIPGLRMKERSYERAPHFLGFDLGMKGDGAAIAITHIVRKEFEGGWRDYIELDTIASRYAADEGKEHFRIEEIAEWIHSYTEKFFVVSGLVDQYYCMALIPLLNDMGVNQIESQHFTRDLNSKIYQNLMSKMLNGGLRIPESEETKSGKHLDIPLVNEMLKLRAKTHSKYLISVEAPQIKDVHDDESDAYSRSVYTATKYLAQGGGVSRNNVVTAAAGGSSTSYKRYLLKQKRNAEFTKRPSSGTRSIGMSHSAALDRIATPLPGAGWR